MSKLFEFSGNVDFIHARPIYNNSDESSLFLSHNHHVDVYFPPSKKSRISSLYISNGESFEPNKKPSIEVLPDESLFEIFTRVAGFQERCACACVSKRWLSLVSNISHDESKIISHDELKCETEDHLSRSLEGKKATDVRLSAIAVGTAGHGGLGKLLIRGSNSYRKITDVGLTAIARCCPSLKVLSIWNVSSVGDNGLSQIANGCQMLEKLDLCHLPAITDKTLLAIAKNCHNLTDLTIETCQNIGNEGLQAIGKHCPNIKSISIKDCPLIGDQGVAGLFSSATFVATKVKLQGLNISDVSLAVIGYYGKAMTDLTLTGLPNITERGYWVMGNGQGLQKLKSLTIISCQGVTDIGLEAIAKGCPNLKQFLLHKCSFLSDNGLVSFTKAAMSLESLQLEECHRITQIGFFGTVLSCGAKLKAFCLANCFGIKDLIPIMSYSSPCKALRSLSIRNCPGFGDACLNVVSRLCPQLHHIELSGLHSITDNGLLPVIENCNAGLVKVNINGCVNLTDKLVSSIAELHGSTLKGLSLDGCKKISDKSLVSIAENCGLISNLDLSKCSITDFGISALAGSNQLNLQIVSISGCMHVTNKSLPDLLKMGQTLLGLNVQNCKGISTNTVDFLEERLWKCDILS